jgi:hypothetical protein
MQRLADLRLRKKRGLGHSTLRIHFKTSQRVLQGWKEDGLKEYFVRKKIPAFLKPVTA